MGEGEGKCSSKAFWGVSTKMVVGMGTGAGMETPFCSLCGISSAPKSAKPVPAQLPQAPSAVLTQQSKRDPGAPAQPRLGRGQ